MSGIRSQAVEVWAAAAGVGLVALMIAWIVGQRLAAIIWEPPVGPAAALGAALVAGAVFTGLAGRRLGGDRDSDRRHDHRPGSQRRCSSLKVRENAATGADRGRDVDQSPAPSDRTVRSAALEQ